VATAPSDPINLIKDHMMMNTPSMAIVAILVALSSAACSGDSQQPDAAAASPSDGQSVDPAKVSPPLKDLPRVKNRAGAIKDLTMGDCATAAGKQRVDGSITSSAEDDVDYLVTVSWTTSTGDVMGRGFKVLEDVAPGETVDFTIKATVSEGATQCVKGAEYGNIS
jgi:hypothetical protein